MQKRDREALTQGCGEGQGPGPGRRTEEEPRGWESGQRECWGHIRSLWKEKWGILEAAAGAGRWSGLEAGI